MDAIMKVFEKVAIRFLWIIHLTHFEKMKYLCPPECYDEDLYGDNAHTYKWPCKERIKKPRQSTLGSHYDVKDSLLDESRLGE